jgi:hypothetical protein
MRQVVILSTKKNIAGRQQVSIQKKLREYHLVHFKN